MHIREIRKKVKNLSSLRFFLVQNYLRFNYFDFLDNFTLPLNKIVSSSHDLIKITARELSAINGSFIS
jgi:hypothetical protein